MRRYNRGCQGTHADRNGQTVRDGKITSKQFADRQSETVQRIDVETFEQNFRRSYSGTHLRTNRRAVGP